MRALSLQQPWATLVAIGAKGYETRSWRSGYRGELAIHASKAYPYWCRELELLEYFAEALVREPRPLPTGAIVALAELADCRKIVRDPDSFLDDPAEAAFGDHTPGRFAWRLINVRKLRTPIPIKGSLSLWTVPPATADRVRLQAGL